MMQESIIEILEAFSEVESVKETCILLRCFCYYLLTCRIIGKKVNVHPNIARLCSEHIHRHMTGSSVPCFGNRKAKVEIKFCN